MPSRVRQRTRNPRDSCMRWRTTRHNRGLGIMTHRVRGDGLGDVGGDGGLADGALDDGFVKVVAAHIAGRGVGIGARGGKDPLPNPFARGAGVLAGQGLGQDNSARAQGQIGLVLGFDGGEVGTQPFDERAGKDGSAVFLAFATTDGDFAPVEVDVLHPQVQGFQQA